MPFTPRLPTYSPSPHDRFHQISARSESPGLWPAAGPANPSIYLLIADRDRLSAVEADLVAELDVQMGLALRVLKASETGDAFDWQSASPAAILTIDRWVAQTRCRA